MQHHGIGGPLIPQRKHLIQALQGLNEATTSIELDPILGLLSPPPPRSKKGIVRLNCSTLVRGWTATVSVPVPLIFLALVCPTWPVHLAWTYPYGRRGSDWTYPLAHFDVILFTGLASAEMDAHLPLSPTGSGLNPLEQRGLDRVVALRPRREAYD